jgi:alpha-N-acetylglucosaminidase
LEEPFRYDLVNLGREVLAQISTPMSINFTAATEQKTIRALDVRTTGETYMAMLHDIDLLVATDQAFLLGSWIAMARSHLASQFF